jgi:nitroimidazol reductase NimA-like FMN-containing flavoprotein (pyridoxamine 5'-phosphate oxidase superfamily)
LEVIVVTAGGPSDEGSDSGSLDDIDPGECWRLVETLPVGRLAVIVGHYPLVFPVNYAVDNQTIVFRTGRGTKLYAIDRSNVSFQVDEIDLVRQQGWSVLVRGVAHELSIEHDARRAARIEAGGAIPWAPGERHHFVRIIPDHITGRRIRPGDLPPASDIRGYL